MREDLCGSDHFPTFILYNNKAAPISTPEWSFKNRLSGTILNLNANNKLEEIASRQLEKTAVDSTTFHNGNETKILNRKLHNPLWNGESEEVIKTFNRELNQFKRNLSHEILQIIK